MAADVGAGSASPGALLKSVPRVAAVLETLRRHGFGDLLIGGQSWPPPDEVRAAIEELGVVFVKFGQVLSTRRDVLPEEYTEALAELQDGMAPLDAAAVDAVISEELGASPAALFASFSIEPLATASIAQVHAAQLADGRRVVVKVQRPDLERRVDEDSLVLGQVAAFLDLTVPRLRPYDLPGMAREFRVSLEAELDFRKEASNIRRFEESLSSDRTVWIPPVVAEMTGRRVLTMERSTGIKLGRLIADRPEEAPALARRLGRLFIRQVFRDGLFHADPHPGNFFVLEDGTLCLHDFGIVGEIGERMREALVSLVDATLAGDGRAATNAYLELGLVPADADRSEMEAEIGRLVRDIRARPLAEVSIGEALGALTRVGGRHRIRNSGSIMLLARAFVTLEGVLSSLDPELSFITMFGDAFKATVWDRTSPERLGRDAVVTARALDHLVREAPDDVRRVLRRWADGMVGRVTVSKDGAHEVADARAARRQERALTAGFLAVAGAIVLGQGMNAVGVPLLTVGGGALFAQLLSSFRR